MYEKYIIGSGSDPYGKYNYVYTYSLLHSHDGLVDLGCEQNSHKLYQVQVVMIKDGTYYHHWNIDISYHQEVKSRCMMVLKNKLKIYR